ncbi:MAG: hypothetical protein AB7O97_03340 [Planctomycetota bacterium]
MNATDRDELQRWLDGDGDPQVRAAFARRMAADPALRAERALHEAVGASLRRGFAVPELAVPTPVAGASPRRWRLFVAGAVFAAAVLLAWLQPWSAPSVADAERIEALRAAVGRSWLAVCGPLDPAQQPSCLAPGELPEFVRPLAPELPSPLVWRQQPGVRFERGVDAASTDGLRVLELVVLPATRVFVFVLPQAVDPHPVLPSDSGWRVFRQVRGPLVLYELTPLGEARGLSCLVEDG